MDSYSREYTIEFSKMSSNLSYLLFKTRLPLNHHHWLFCHSLIGNQLVIEYVLVI